MSVNTLSTTTLRHTSIIIIVYFVTLWQWQCSQLQSSCCCFVVFVDAMPSPTRQEERYSFSLTTFDPNGRLGQVERAQQAAIQGIPIITLVLQQNQNQNNQLVEVENERMIIMIAPQILPSIFMIDDGTTRFTQLTNEIYVSHSGISADGRILVATAQRMVLEYEYTFDTTIPCSILINQLSLLMQQYTMKPGIRPFGSIIIVAYLPINPIEQPQIYRIDVSGTVDSINDCCSIIHNNKLLQRFGLLEKLNTLVDQISAQQVPFDADIIQSMVVELLQQALMSSDNNNNTNTNQQYESITKQNSLPDDTSNLLVLSSNDKKGDEQQNSNVKSNDDDDDVDVDNDLLDIDGYNRRQEGRYTILTACLRSLTPFGKTSFTRKRWNN